ncbi:hypothetical protein XANCAGTX0491_008230 [Xanthoria calcicola]
MSMSLENLPPELLGNVVSYIDEVKILLRLTLTCKKLHDFIERDGYRIFVQTRYPPPIPPFWKDATHALTKLARAWEQKSLIPRYIKPPQDADKPRARQPGSRTRGQTMGYQPVIDSYEAWIGPDWSSRRETLAWGAGSDLVLRVKWMGPEVESRWRRTPPGQSESFDQHHHESTWWQISEPELLSGRDDITTINLLRNEQRPSSDAEYTVVGRASGGLDLVSTKHKDPRSWKRETRFETDGQTVRAVSVNKAIPPLLAACLGDRIIAIYHIVIGGEGPVQCLGKIHFDSLKSPCRLWSTVFLRHDRLAVSLGPHVEPIRVFEIQPDSIPSKDLRRFSFTELRHGQHAPGKPTTAYALAPLPRSSCPSESEGDLFLSGGYDGTIRLHDLRSPASYVATFQDPIDSNAAIYSLLPLGRDRFLAGTAQFATLKLFNMPLAVDKLCRHNNSSGSLFEGSRVQVLTSSHDKDVFYPEQSNAARARSRGWTCFLADRERSSRGGSRRPREWASPVYSLACPSLCSPTIFAGIEDHVIQVDIADAYDRFPDPIYKYGPESTGKRDSDATRKWDPDGNVMRVNLYEHVHTNMEILHQARIGERMPGDAMPGCDERWYTLGGKRISR